MKKKKLMEKLQHFFDAGKKEKLANIDEIKEVLTLLKQKELKIKNEISECADSEKVIELQRSVDIIYAQRHKALTLIKELQQ
ncbi:MAG: hypothetical protein PSN04_07310 [Methyloprofundus sp.]|nr:hypothetical protein [Methyloprofundus sp.]